MLELFSRKYQSNTRSIVRKKAFIFTVDRVRLSFVDEADVRTNADIASGDVGVCECSLCV